MAAAASRCIGRGWTRREYDTSGQRLAAPNQSNQARTLLEAARGDRLEALYVLAVHTGMRQGELLALRWEDVDLERGVLRVRGTKTARSRRTVKLSQTALEALTSHLPRQLEEDRSGGLPVAGERLGVRLRNRYAP